MWILVCRLQDTVEDDLYWYGEPNGAGALDWNYWGRDRYKAKPLCKRELEILSSKYEWTRYPNGERWITIPISVHERD